MAGQGRAKIDLVLCFVVLLVDASAFVYRRCVSDCNNNRVRGSLSDQPYCNTLKRAWPGKYLSQS